MVVFKDTVVFGGRLGGCVLNSPDGLVTRCVVNSPDDILVVAGCVLSAISVLEFAEDVEACEFALDLVVGCSTCCVVALRITTSSVVFGFVDAFQVVIGCLIVVWLVLE